MKNSVCFLRNITLESTAKDVILRNISFLERESFISKEMISEFDWKNNAEDRA